jgi:hypothetical protein
MPRRSGEPCVAAVRFNGLVVTRSTAAEGAVALTVALERSVGVLTLSRDQARTLAAALMALTNTEEEE